MTTKKITISAYLLTRLHELGIKHIFGMPGDYNLLFLDQIIQDGQLKWIGTCNELNAAYASDGYARINGMSALLTTFGVGELSAINGIAGAFAEYVPIIHVVGMPATHLQENHMLLHHTLGNGRFDIFSNMYKEITVAQTILSKENAAVEIDDALMTAWLKKRPVYIGISANICKHEIDAPKEALVLKYPSSNQLALNEFIERASNLIKQAKSPVVLIDKCIQAQKATPLILEFLQKTGLPFATLSMGKAILDETHPQFIGVYNGKFGDQNIQQQVENSDCLIAFGALLSDFNTAGFTANIGEKIAIEIHGYWARFQQSYYKDVVFVESIPSLIKQLENYHYSEKMPAKKMERLICEDKPFTHQRFWKLMGNFLEKDVIVIAETGTSMFGVLETIMPAGTTFISQPLWGSIGYATGALLGACLAAPKRQVILFVGDGSLQLTVQELSTIARLQLTPTIFLINNNGYTIERVIHGAEMEYNDIQSWRYTELPKIFSDNVWTVSVKTEKELENALQERKKHANKLALIELIMEKMDAPLSLIKASENYR